MVTHITSIDVGKYRHNVEGFCKNVTYPKSINMERTNTLKNTYKIFRITLVSSIFLLVKGIEKKIQSNDNCVDMNRG